MSELPSPIWKYFQFRNDEAPTNSVEDRVLSREWELKNIATFTDLAKKADDDDDGDVLATFVKAAEGTKLSKILVK